MRIRQIASLSFALCTAYACSVSNAPTPGSPGYGLGGGEGTQTILGDWSGPYSNSSGGSNLADDQTMNAHVHFDGQSDTSGNFIIELPDLKDAKVQGTFQRTQGTPGELQLVNQGSPGITTIGDTLQYDLYGSTRMSLHNSRMHIELKRNDTNAGGTGGTSGGSTTGGGGQTTPSQQQDAVYGHWQCTDNPGNLWNIFIRTTGGTKGNGSFSADVASGNGSASSLWLQGDLTITRGKGTADAVLVVRDASVAKYKGMELDVNTDGDNVMTVKRIGTSDNFSCSKQ